MGCIINLLESSDKVKLPEYDIGIIGAGAAGAYLANRLSQLGLNAALIEAGTEVCKPLREIGFGAEFIRSYYPGAVEGRAFGLGGSTSRWGGLFDFG